jgi:hypothetical protein
LLRAAEGSALEGVLLRRRNGVRAINDVGQVVGTGNTTTRYQSHTALVNPT